MKKINKNMTFEEVLKKYPQTAEVFLEAGMHCIGCIMASGETIEQGAKAHGIDVKKLLEKLNKSI